MDKNYWSSSDKKVFHNSHKYENVCYSVKSFKKEYQDNPTCSHSDVRHTEIDAFTQWTK